MDKMNRREFIGKTAVAVGAALGSKAPASESKTNLVTGRVLFDGEPPARKAIDCSADPYCSRIHSKEPLLEEELVVDQNGGLQNVFVCVKSGFQKDKKWPVPKEHAVLHHKKCRFEPHVFGLMPDQPLDIVNNDKTLENAHGLTRINKEFNIYQPEKGMVDTVVMSKPETFKIKCEVHPWESSWCHVMNHPFFAVTDAKGKFVITGLIPGEYELEYWHEKLGRQTKKIKVGVSETTEIADIKFKPKGRSKKRT